MLASGEAAGGAAPPASDLTGLTIEELMKLEVQTVYSASKHEQQVTEAPSSVTIITSDDIKKNGYRTLADVMRGVRSFYVTYDRNYAYLGARGFGRPGDYNSRILLLVDGHAINDNIYDTATIGTEFIIDADLIDRIEISRGPGSSLYGSNAFFGIINIMTKSGHDIGGAQLSAEGGSHGVARGRASYGTGGPGSTEVLVSASTYNSAGQDIYFPEFDTPETNNGIAEGADYDRNASAFAKLSYKDVTLTGGYVYRKKGIPTASFETVFNTKRTYTIDAHKYAELLYRSAVSDRADLLARLSYDEYEYFGDYLSFADPPGTGHVIKTDDVTGRWWAGEVKYSAILPGRNKLTLGAAFKDNVAQDQMNYDKDPHYLSLDDRRRSFLWAIYAQDEVKLLDSLILNAGLRYDHYDTFGGTANPRLGLIYRPNETASFKILSGRAFRAPNAYELYYNDGGYTAKANPDLDPETISTYEAVYEQYLGGRLRGSASFYHYDIRNLISLETDPADGLLVYRNIEDVRANGVELEIEGRSERGTRGVLSYAVQKTEDRNTGLILTNSPRHLAKLTVNVPFLRQRAFAGVEEQYMSTRRTVSGRTVGDFFITNITLLVNRVLGPLELSASVYNLFDKKYGDPASEEHVQDSIRQDGRNFRVKATCSF